MRAHVRRALQYRRAREGVGVVVLPFDVNPYQGLLYSAMVSQIGHGVRVSYWRRRPWVGLALFFPFTAWRRLRGDRVAHVHWPAWDLRLEIPGRSYLSSVLTRLALAWLGLLRYKVVWTVHNVVSHERRTSDDVDVSKRLARIASRLIVHSPATVGLLAEHGIANAQSTVIPHGNYVGVYGPDADRGEARRALGLASATRVVLFFGQIRPYKGVEELIETWSRLRLDATLLIVGSALEGEYQARLSSQAALAHVDLRLGRVPDDKVTTYFAACDAVCLPFLSTTTSGSALLALSLGRGLIAPRIGALADLPPEVGFFYSQHDVAGGDLADALLRFMRADDTDLAIMSKQSRKVASDLDWSGIAQETYSLYQEVLTGS